MAAGKQNGRQGREDVTSTVKMAADNVTDFKMAATSCDVIS